MATLLIVEDDKQTSEAICEYLKSAGHKIIPAYDGADALQIFNQEDIDLPYSMRYGSKALPLFLCLRRLRMNIRR